MTPIYIDEYEQYIFAVFNQLASDRPQGMTTIASIPMSAFINYQTLFEDSLNIDEILLLQALDSTFKNTLASLKEK